MTQLLTLLEKEIVEMARNFKLIWVPISFILLGVIDPLTTYYMPQILDSVGGLPEGAVIEIPVPSAAEVLITSMGEYQTIGVLIIALSLMGTIAGERKSGVAQLILVKPVSYFSYITSKWISGLILFIFSLFLGLMASWYYTGILFEFIPIADFLAAAMIYALWLALVVTVVIFFSALIRQPGAAAAISIATVLIWSLIGGSFSHLLEWSPTQLFDYASNLLMTGRIPQNTLPATFLTAGIIVLLLVLAVMVLRQQELAD